MPTLLFMIPIMQSFKRLENLIIQIMSTAEQAQPPNPPKHTQSKQTNKHQINMHVPVERVGIDQKYLYGFSHCGYGSIDQVECCALHLETVQNLAKAYSLKPKEQNKMSAKQIHIKIEEKKTTKGKCIPSISKSSLKQVTACENSSESPLI